MMKNMEWMHVGMLAAAVAILVAAYLIGLRAWVWFNEAMGWLCRHEWKLVKISHSTQKPHPMLPDQELTLLSYQCQKNESHWTSVGLPGHHDFTVEEVPEAFKDAWKGN